MLVTACPPYGRRGCQMLDSKEKTIVLSSIQRPVSSIVEFIALE